MLRTTLISTCLAAALFTFPAWADDEKPKSKPLSIGDQAPAVDIAHWIKGVEMDKKGAFEPVTEFGNDHVYVLEFWATWCGPCVAGMPHLSELQEKFHDDVTIIGVSDESLPKVINFLFQKYNDGKLHNERTEYTIATDPDKSVWDDYFYAAGQAGIPCAFIIGSDGYVEWIGHPMGMDIPLKEVVAGTWDRQAFKNEWNKEQKLEQEYMAIMKNIRKANAEKDWKTMLNEYDRLIELDPDNGFFVLEKFQVLLRDLNQPKKAYGLGIKLAEQHQDDAQLLNAMAWFIATEPGIEKRNLEFAQDIAHRACKLTDNEEAAILDTLARVYYEQGKLRQAIKWQKKAVEHAEEGMMADEIKATLAKYLDEAK